MAVLRSDSITPAFPQIGQVFQKSSQEIGLLISLFALPSVFLTPILGILADRWGRRRVLVPSLLLFGLAGGLCAFARDFQLLLALRLLHGIGAAALSMLNITLVADLYRGDKRTAAMGYNASIRSLGSMVFPIIGGALAALSWQYPFALAWLALPIAAWVGLALDTPVPKNDYSLGKYLKQIGRSVQSWKVAVLFLSGCVVFIIMFGAYLNYYPFLLDGRFNAPAWIIGGLISARSMVNLIVASQLGRMTRHVSVERLLVISFALYALAFSLIPLMPSLKMMLPAAIILGLAEGLYWPSSQALLGSLAPLNNRAGFLAANDMVLKVGQSAGPLLMGIVIGWGSFDVVFYVAAGGALMMVGLLAYFLERD